MPLQGLTLSSIKKPQQLNQLLTVGLYCENSFLLQSCLTWILSIRFHVLVPPLRSVHL